MLKNEAFTQKLFFDLKILFIKRNPKQTLNFYYKKINELNLFFIPLYFLFKIKEFIYRHRIKKRKDLGWQLILVY